MLQYDLERFINAQQHSYIQALQEIKSGHKTSHWIWFIFPQLKELGKSHTAVCYGIDGIDEALQYLKHPILGARLHEITEVLLSLSSNDPYDVMGSRIDGVKLQSSMTLFAEIEGNNSGFAKVLNKYFGGQKDAKTIKLLEAQTTSGDKISIGKEG